MAIRIDPEQNETRALERLYPVLTGRSVLEIGSGDGRLTWRYADRAARVVVIEPDEDKHATALAGRTSAFDHVEFLNLDLEAYFQQCQERFDLAILSWSL